MTTATVTIQWEWVGQGPAPSKVWVRKESTAYATCTPSGEMTVDNGLGSQTITYNESPHKTKICSGNKLEKVSLQGNLLKVNFSASALAESFGPGPNYGNQCSTNVGYSISLKSVGLDANIGQTFKKGGTEANPVPVPSDPGVVDTTGANIYGVLLGQQQVMGFGLSPWFYRSLVGIWGDNPYHYWSDGDLSWGDSLFSEYTSYHAYWLFPLTAVQGMAAGSPQVKTVSVRVNSTDQGEDPTPLTAQLKVNIRTSHVKPVHIMDSLTETKRTPDDFQVASPGYAQGGGGINCEWGYTRTIWDVFTLVNSGSSAIQNPMIEAILGILGMVAEDLTTKPAEGVAPWAWGWPDSIYDGSTTPPVSATDPNRFSVWQGYKMYPVLKMIYRETTWEAEKWGTNGYQGQVQSKGERKTGAQWYGVFLTFNRNDPPDFGGL